PEVTMLWGPTVWLACQMRLKCTVTQTIDSNGDIDSARGHCCHWPAATIKNGLLIRPCMQPIRFRGSARRFELFKMSPSGSRSLSRRIRGDNERWNCRRNARLITMAQPVSLPPLVRLIDTDIDCKHWDSV